MNTQRQVAATKPARAGAKIRVTLMTIGNKFWVEKQGLARQENKW